MAPRLQYHNVMVGPDPTICSRMARDPRVEPEGDEDRMKAAGAIRRPFSWVSVTMGRGLDPCPPRRFPLPLGPPLSTPDFQPCPEVFPMARNKHHLIGDGNTGGTLSLLARLTEPAQLTTFHQ